ncbi:MAG: DUF4399 domain-containing protein [Gemmatimonadetes bacterium]|nr:DUF4399 domain-containing protein [Gemmatimonadota bacterium]
MMQISRFQYVAVTGLFVLSACRRERPAEKPAEEAPAMLGRATILLPVDGDTVGPDSVRVVLAAEGVIVEPATGERIEGRGHHHIFVDKDVTPDTAAIPKDVEGIIHLGTGASEFTVKGLTPGEHRLIAVLAYGDHVPMERVAYDTLRIYVRAP